MKSLVDILKPLQEEYNKMIWWGLPKNLSINNQKHRNMSDKIRVVQAPNSYSAISPDECFIYLGGSYDNSPSGNWQEDAIQYFKNVYHLENYTRPICILNPRRDEWNPDWERLGDPNLIVQTNWEMDAAYRADCIYNFLGNSKSGTGLLQLAASLMLDDGEIVITQSKRFHKFTFIEMLNTSASGTIKDNLLEAVEFMAQSVNEGYKKENERAAPKSGTHTTHSAEPGKVQLVFNPALDKALEFDLDNEDEEEDNEIGVVKYEVGIDKYKTIKVDTEIVGFEIPLGSLTADHLVCVGTAAPTMLAQIKAQIDAKEEAKRR